MREIPVKMAKAINVIFQSKILKMSAPKRGANIGASSPNACVTDNTCDIDFPSKLSLIKAVAIATIPPAPTAEAARAIIKKVMVGEIAHRPLNIKEIEILAIKIGFRPYLSLIGPRIKMPIAMKIKKIVMVELINVEDVLKYAVISGNAGIYKSVDNGGIIDSMVINAIKPEFFKYFCFITKLLV